MPQVMRLRDENEALMETLVRAKVELAETQGKHFAVKQGQDCLLCCSARVPSIVRSMTGQEGLSFWLQWHADVAQVPSCYRKPSCENCDFLRSMACR